MKKNDLTYLGKRIRDLRISNNITQKDLSDRIGITQSIMSNYETGARIPKEGRTGDC